MLNYFQNFIELLFSFGLFINAGLFIPQIIRLYKVKSSQGLSLLTFAGFNFIQLAIVLHGLIKHDYLLAAGFALSFITCGIITILIIYYNNKKF
jgi:MtN3 and saliva related transmembrane protein